MKHDWVVLTENKCIKIIENIYLYLVFSDIYQRMSWELSFFWDSYFSTYFFSSLVNSSNQDFKKYIFISILIIEAAKTDLESSVYIVFPFLKISYMTFSYEIPK